MRGADVEGGESGVKAALRSCKIYFEDIILFQPQYRSNFKPKECLKTNSLSSSSSLSR
jgi:hypothetical protein